MQAKASYTVLQVTPALDAGGVERTTIEVAEALTKRGARALVASRGGRLEEELATVGGVLFRMPLETKNPLEIYANAGKLAALARAENVDIIHARSRAPAWSALWAARRLKLPFVTTYHGVYNAKSAPKRWYNSVMARGDLVIANSDFTRAHVLREHNVSDDRVISIPRGVDLARFDRAAIGEARMAAMRQLWGLSPSDTRPVVLLPGRLTFWKGQTVLIEAAAILEKEHPGGAVYVLAGDSQGRQQYVADLHELAGNRGVEDAVKVVGHLVDMPAALAAATVAVFPSTDAEAFGRAAVEAQAMGVPVVASNMGGLAETIVDGDSGFLVPPADARSLASALNRVLALSPEQRKNMGERGSARVRARYSVEALQTATLKVYERLLKERR